MDVKAYDKSFIKLRFLFFILLRMTVQRKWC